MRFERFRFIPVLIFVLVVMILAANLLGLVQPSRTDITGVNSLWWEPYELTVHLDMIDDDFVMYYDSMVLAQSDNASWSGEATVYYMNAYFKQQCETLRSGSRCCKQWRGKWAYADIHSPLSQVAMWQDLISAGDGAYEERPVYLSDYSDTLAAHYDGKCYRMELSNVPLDWASLCDVNLDLSFGGEDRLQNIPTADVTLFYGTEDLLLKAVLISYMDDTSWLSATFCVTPSDETHILDLSDYEMQDGLLNEEWDILIPGAK